MPQGRGGPRNSVSVANHPPHCPECSAARQASGIQKKTGVPGGTPVMFHVRLASPEGRRETHPTLLRRGGLGRRRLGGRRLSAAGGSAAGGSAAGGSAAGGSRRRRRSSRGLGGRRLSRGRLCSRGLRRRRRSSRRFGRFLGRRCRRLLSGRWRRLGRLAALRREVIDDAENDDRDDDVQNCTATTTAAARRPSVTHLRPPMVGYVPKTSDSARSC